MMMFDAPTRDFVPWADVNPLTGSNGPSTPTETPISYLSRIPLSSSSSGGGGAVTFPVISLSADPATVYPGQPFNLTWDVAGASSCEALGSVPNFTGSKTLSGTLPYPSGLASEGTYIAKLTCVHPDGYSKSKEATVTVLPEPPVIVNMSATPTTLVRGGTTRITWDAGTALACTATGTLPGWSGSKGVSGSQDITVSAAGTYTAELSCTRYARSGAATVEIISQPYPPIIFTEFRADPTPVIGGTSTNVNWQTANATACEGRLTPYPSSSTFDSWVGTKTTTGGQGFSTNKIGTFTLILRCTNPDNDQSRQIDVSVTPPSRPTVDVAVSPSSITQGATTTVMFTASGATSCTAGGNVNGWSGSKPATGSSTDLTVTQGAGTYSATVLCSNLGGDTTGSADLTVSPPAGGCTCPSGTNQIDPGHCSNPSDGRVFDCGAMTSPAASITATPTRFYQGQATNLCWTCENAYSTSVAGLPGWGGARPTNSCEVVTVTSTGQYTAQVACGNAVSTAYASTMVEVQTAPNPSIDSFYADAYELDSGANARVYYSTSNATSCTASGMPTGRGRGQAAVPPTTRLRRTMATRPTHCSWCART